MALSHALYVAVLSSKCFSDRANFASLKTVAGKQTQIDTVHWRRKKAGKKAGEMINGPAVLRGHVMNHGKFCSTFRNLMRFSLRPIFRVERGV